jgi:GT2 family glycosyltransferase
MKSKIGIAVITCNRPKLFSKNIASIPPADTLVVVNDGLEYPSEFYPSSVKEVFQHKKKMGVAVSKNQALKFLIEDGCEHIFLCEDDVKIVNDDVFDIYIKTGEASGIYHLNYAYHGPLNKDSNGNPKPRKVISFENDISLSLNLHICGAFSYYTKFVIDKVGMMDERFINSYEHLDHTYQIIKAGFHPPFWWFADVANSDRYIEDLDPDLKMSVIRKRGINFFIRLKYYGFLFRLKNGSNVQEIQDVDKVELQNAIDLLRKNRICKSN